MPTFYQIASSKRVTAEKQNFEGQLPKLRYFHPKAQEENTNKTNQLPEMQLSGAKRKGKGQTKITGEFGLLLLIYLIFEIFPFFTFDFNFFWPCFLIA